MQTVSVHDNDDNDVEGEGKWVSKVIKNLFKEFIFGIKNSFLQIRMEKIFSKNGFSLGINAIKHFGRVP